MASLGTKTCRILQRLKKQRIERNLQTCLTRSSTSQIHSVKAANTTLYGIDINTRKHWKCHQMTCIVKSLNTSVPLLKKFKESDYERVQIFEPNGEYLCTAEMIVLEKFCHQFRRYTFQEMEDAKKTEGVTENKDLRGFQIVDKKTGETGIADKSELKQKKTKEIKFHKDASAGPKLNKILEILVDHGKVNISFDETGTKVEKEVKKALEDFSTFKMVARDRGAFYFATVKDIDTKMVTKLFDIVHKQEADHIAEVRKYLLDNTKEAKV